MGGDTIISMTLEGTVLTLTVQNCCDAEPRVITVELSSLTV